MFFQQVQQVGSKIRLRGWLPKGWLPKGWLYIAQALLKAKGSKLRASWSASWSEATTEHNYWVASTAPAETLWKEVSDLAGVAAWHPLISRTNAPYGQQAKPGLIYRVFSDYLPTSTQIFVERVLPGELLSVRVFPLPGLQERATYRIVSTLYGACVMYSITLSGWLSPIVWPVVKSRITQVAIALVKAAEVQAAEKAAQ